MGSNENPGLNITDSDTTVSLKDETNERKINDSESADKSLDLSSQNLQEFCIQQLTDKYQSNCLTVLNLDYNDLCTLPKGFCKCLPQLQVFSANGNLFKTLTADVGSLTCLTELHLCENELTSLPNSVQYLVNLKCMKLTGNQLSCLPEDFGELSSLEELFVEENKLTKFPPTFALLEKLRILEASDNVLNVLPKYLGNLKSLTHLNVTSNKLEMLPESFSQLEQLVCVDVSNNQLKILPLACSSHKTLEKFFGGLNSLTEFPLWLGQLPQLTDLCLKENRIGGNCLPDDFGQVCKKLRYLDLRGNLIEELPESFGELENLEFAHFGSLLEEMERKHLSNGNWLHRLPASFTKLTMLTTLRLDENQLQFLPDDFGHLQNLEFLNLGHNYLHDLPESFGNLRKLRVCILSRNNLQLLPSSTGQLCALEEFHLAYNLLGELPESFKALIQLQLLDLFDNKLTQIPACLEDFKNLKYLDLHQNPLKIKRKMVPYIKSIIQYMPRTKDTNSVWRGRMRVGVTNNVEYVVSDVNEEADEEEMADEPVDELYGSEDIPYNWRFLRNDIGSVPTWRTHNGRETRPLFFRGTHCVEPRAVPSSSTSEDGEKEDSSCGWSENDNELEQYDNQQVPFEVSDNTEGADELWELPKQEEDWESTNPVVTHPELENWEVPSPAPPDTMNRATEEENWEQELQTSSPLYSEPSPAPPDMMNRATEEENWEEELQTSSPLYSHEDVDTPRSNNFAYSSSLKDFFMGPFDLHAVRTYRPKIDDPNYKEPEVVQGQFSDTESDS